MTSDHFYYPSIVCFILLGISLAFFAAEVFYSRSKGKRNRSAGNEESKMYGAVF